MYQSKYILFNFFEFIKYRRKLNFIKCNQKIMKTLNIKKSDWKLI